MREDFCRNFVIFVSIVFAYHVLQFRFLNTKLFSPYLIFYKKSEFISQVSPSIEQEKIIICIKM